MTMIQCGVFLNAVKGLMGPLYHNMWWGVTAFECQHHPFKLASRSRFQLALFAANDEARSDGRGTILCVHAYALYTLAYITLAS